RIYAEVYRIESNPRSDSIRFDSLGALTGKVWTGTLPVWECVGTPIASATNKVAKVPDYVLRKQQNQNAENEKYARETVSVTKEKK
ncbi:hypothetical protein V8F06_012029, partial [Rhypophila decipiens]